MSVEKSSEQILRFTGTDCRVTVTDQVVVEVDVRGGVQSINFPVHVLPDVAGLLASVDGDTDVADLVVEHTPQAEDESEAP